MRFETYAAGHDLVERIEKAGIARSIRDDGDLILVHLHSGQTIAIYLIERPTSLNDMQHYYTANIAKGWYPVCIFQVKLLLPDHDTWYVPDDWMHTLLALHHNQIYAFDAVGRQAYFFPVHFYGHERARHIRWGDLIDVATLHAETITHQGFEWHAAMFGGAQRPVRPVMIPKDALVEAFELLGLRGDESLVDIKRAYREMARRYHPDLNPGREALYRMKEINLAYKRIVAARDI
jgi:hypothetical protein